MDMNLNEISAAVEAVLFASGEPVSCEKLSQVCGAGRADIRKSIELLNQKYSENGSALQVLSLENDFQLCTKPQFANIIRLALEKNRNTPLSQAAMEALTVIAYNQPVTKSFVENVRGVDSSAVVNKLVERGLVEEYGRLDIPGKPVAYKTTSLFLRSFGLSSINELPSVDVESVQAVSDTN